MPIDAIAEISQNPLPLVKELGNIRSKCPPIYSNVRLKKALSSMRDRGLWNGSFNGRESTLQQLAPYVGKLKSGMVYALISHFTKRGNWICDPFSGSGVVALEALLLGRKTIANDLNKYAFCITKAKTTAPRNEQQALLRTEAMLKYVRNHWQKQDIRRVPKWVRLFFHPRTLKETLCAFKFCRKEKDWFLSACLCGILHHQRPGFLSYPASHMVPYLRTSLFPPKEYPELYQYRPLEERIIAKVQRAFRRPFKTTHWCVEDSKVCMRDARKLPFRKNTVDFILTSPPYYDALDYARDNRLRLWFLGVPNWKSLKRKLSTRNSIYEQHMTQCLQEMYRLLKKGKYCVLVVGIVGHNGWTKDVAEILSAIAMKVTKGGFRCEAIIEDEIPDIRRSRRGTKTTKIEKIIVLKKIA